MAKKFRKEPTPYEDIAWQLLRNRKICNTKWRRQQLIGGYIADFYCPELALILEIDGAVHNTPEAIAYDECRTYLFNTKNINVIRVKNDDCNAEWLTSIIQQYKSAYLNTPLSPSPIGREGSRQADRGGEVKNCRIYYTSVADYMTREEKLDYLSNNNSIASKEINWQLLTPDEHGDWLNKRVGGDYDTYPRIGDKKDKSGEANKVFCDNYSNGLKTNRDVWCYNFSIEFLRRNIKECINFYNLQREAIANKIITDVDNDSTKISWSDTVKIQLQRGIVFNELNGVNAISIYRPYMKSNLYYSHQLNDRQGVMPSIFPVSIINKSSDTIANRIISVSGVAGKKNFACLMTDCIPCYDMIEKGQCFPLYIYDTDEKPKSKEQRSLFGSASSPSPIGRGGDVTAQAVTEGVRSGITDWILDFVNKKYNLVASSPSPIGRGGAGGEVTKEDIFYYVYGILHCPSYREKYQNDFKKALPRIPFVERYEDFVAFMKAGRELGDLHCDYESCPMNTTAQIVEDGSQNYIIDKLRPVGKGNFTELKYNGHITIKNIPPEAHEYIVNGRSPLGWIIDQYQVSIDKDSGIKNDPNDWCREHNNPRYILELIMRVIEVSVRTVRIVKGLPKVEV